MKQLLEQLTMLYGAVVALEESLPALPEDWTAEDTQNARDLIIAINAHLDGIELAVLGTMPDMALEYEILDCAVGLSPLTEGVL